MASESEEESVKSVSAAESEDYDSVENEDSDRDATSDAEDDADSTFQDSSSKYGVIYLSRIPTKMNVKIVREYFEQFGTVGRIYLQPSKKTLNFDRKGKKRRPKNFREFDEGWVEYTDRNVAREVAQVMNNQPVGGRKRHPWVEELWNIKYLQGFRWNHLNERLAYEKAIKTKRLRLEVGQAKREAQLFAENLEFSKRLEKSVDNQKDNELNNVSGKGKRKWEHRQRLPEDEILRRKEISQQKAPKKSSQPQSAGSSSNFLSSLFTAGN